MLFFVSEILTYEKQKVVFSPDGSGILCRRGSAGKIERTAGGVVLKKNNCSAPKKNYFHFSVSNKRFMSLRT